jgi:hypothetical protein
LAESGKPKSDRRELFNECAESLERRKCVNGETCGFNILRP